MYIDIMLEVFKKMIIYLTYEIMTASIIMNEEQRNILHVKGFSGIADKKYHYINNYMFINKQGAHKSFDY